MNDSSYEVLSSGSDSEEEKKICRYCTNTTKRSCQRCLARCCSNCSSGSKFCRICNSAEYTSQSSGMFQAKCFHGIKSVKCIHCLKENVIPCKQCNPEIFCKECNEVSCVPCLSNILASVSCKKSGTTAAAEDIGAEGTATGGTLSAGGTASSAAAIGKAICVKRQSRFEKIRTTIFSRDYLSVYCSFCSESNTKPCHICADPSVLFTIKNKKKKIGARADGLVHPENKDTLGVCGHCNHQVCLKCVRKCRCDKYFCKQCFDIHNENPCVYCSTCYNFVKISNHCNMCFVSEYSSDDVLLSKNIKTTVKRRGTFDITNSGKMCPDCQHNHCPWCEAHVKPEEKHSVHGTCHLCQKDSDYVHGFILGAEGCFSLYHYTCVLCFIKYNRLFELLITITDSRVIRTIYLPRLNYEIDSVFSKDIFCSICCTIAECELQFLSSEFTGSFKISKRICKECKRDEPLLSKSLEMIDNSDLAGYILSFL